MHTVSLTILLCIRKKCSDSYKTFIKCKSLHVFLSIQPILEDTLQRHVRNIPRARSLHDIPNITIDATPFSDNVSI
jgi:hypothetical protein